MLSKTEHVILFAETGMERYYVWDLKESMWRREIFYGMSTFYIPYILCTLGHLNALSNPIHSFA